MQFVLKGRTRAQSRLPGEGKEQRLHVALLGSLSMCIFVSQCRVSALCVHLRQENGTNRPECNLPHTHTFRCCWLKSREVTDVRQFTNLLQRNESNPVTDWWPGNTQRRKQDGYSLVIKLEGGTGGREVG